MSQGPLQIQPGCRLLSCTIRQRLGVSGSGVGGCEPPAPGFCVGLSQSECYCKVSGFARHVPLPLRSPPSRAGLRRLPLPAECLYPLLEVVTPAPTGPPASSLPAAPSTCSAPSSWPLPTRSPLPDLWVPVGLVMGGRALPPLCALPQQGEPREAHTCLQGRSPRSGEMPPDSA